AGPRVALDLATEVHFLNDRIHLIPPLQILEFIISPFGLSVNENFGIYPCPGNCVRGWGHCIMSKAFRAVFGGMMCFAENAVGVLTARCSYGIMKFGMKFRRKTKDVEYCPKK
ncbi:MAG: hypothetical protein IKZ16_00645, partial [Clostridia bacterium]|nr:hypothetical protein [Clostridia bacterium]